MLFDLPAEVVTVMVMYLKDYRDYRQLLWLCRAGGSILAHVQSLDVDGMHGVYGCPFDYGRFPALLQVSVTIRICMRQFCQGLLQIAKDCMITGMHIHLSFDIFLQKYNYTS